MILIGAKVAVDDEPGFEIGKLAMKMDLFFFGTGMHKNHVYKINDQNRNINLF